MARLGKWHRRIGIGAVLLLGLTAGAGEQVFDLEEVPVWELAPRIPAFVQGRKAVCAARPDPNVRVYPALQSDKPVYGTIQFGKAEPCRFVVDESGGPGSGYDRLYLDRNGDRDLRNDAPLTPKTDWPEALQMRWTSIERQVLFESVGIPLPCGAEGLRPLEVMPRLLLYRGGGSELSFVPAKARRGHVVITGQQYEVFLGQASFIRGWFDQRQTDFYLLPPGGPRAQSPLTAAASLMMLPRLGEAYYRFAATPAGDKLFVRPYEGPLGDFMVGGGKFAAADLTITGWLQSSDTVVAVDGPCCRLPAGDYALALMALAHKELTFAVQRNSFSEGTDRRARSSAYPIHIRPDTPFVLDFSHPPQMVFVWPAKGQRAKVGDRVFVQAVLVDPTLDFVICNLNYGPPQAGAGAVNPMETVLYRRNTSLFPQVTIARSNGKIVAQGTMGYG